MLRDTKKHKTVKRKSTNIKRNDEEAKNDNWEFQEATNDNWEFLEIAWRLPLLNWVYPTEYDKKE